MRACGWHSCLPKVPARFVNQHADLNMIILLRINQTTFLCKTQQLGPCIHAVCASVFIHLVILANEDCDAIQFFSRSQLLCHLRQPLNHRFWKVSIRVDARGYCHHTCKEVRVAEGSNHSPYGSHTETDQMDTIHVHVLMVLRCPLLKHRDKTVTKDIQLACVIVKVRLRTFSEVREVLCHELRTSLRKRLRLELRTKDD
mmetsp:Transcript_44884/g.81905  ORF Transcript_44884/g.81905 Transcript_44884/m.81905 type:complete len:200 (+) Transcript_44884:105-704(+)